MTMKKKVNDPLSTETWIDLDEADYMSIGLRPRVPKPLPLSKAFNLVEALAIIEKQKQTTYAQVEFSKLHLPPTMRRPEANFWLRAILAQSHNAFAILKELQTVPSFDVDIDSLDARLDALHFRLPPEAAIPLFAMMGFPSMLAWMNGLRSRHARHRLVEGLREYVLPYVSEADCSVARPIVLGWLRRDSIEIANTPAQDVAVLAAEIGIRLEVRERLEQIRPLTYFAADRRDIVLRLGDPDLLLAELARKDCPIDSPILVRQCLALAEIRCVDALVDRIMQEPNKTRAEALTKALTRVHAPEMAHEMLELLVEGVAAPIARGWFTDNPARAAMGLAAIEPAGKLSDDARQVLKDLCRQGYAEIVRQYAGEDGDPGSPSITVDEAVPLPAELESVLPRSAKPHATDPPLSSLPAIDIDRARLEGPQLIAVFESMRLSTLEKPHPLIATLRRIAAPHFLDAFAVALLKGWIYDQMPVSARWRLIGATLIGGDGFVLELSKRIHEWPGQSGHARSVHGLRCLLTVGTDEAFSQLALIADKSKYAGLKKKARETMADLAQARGLTVEQLEDRVVPRCGLGEGARYFEFAGTEGRRFRLVLSGEMKPMLKADDGRVSSEFPAARKADDPAAVARAKADWAIVKKLAAQTAKTQAERFEQSMVRCRRWQAADFMSYIVGHPIVSLVAQRLVWAAYIEGSPQSTFRITEDLTLADAADRLYALAADAMVGIVHPVALTEGERGAWGELLSDYELIPPFRQLTREMYLLRADERSSTELNRYRGQEVDNVAQKILGHKHWAIVEDYVIGDHYRKVFDLLGATVVVKLGPGTWLGTSPAFPIIDCSVYRGVHVDDKLTRDDQIRWGDVDPIIPSEVLRDLNGAINRGR